MSTQRILVRAAAAVVAGVAVWLFFSARTNGPAPVGKLERTEAGRPSVVPPALEGRGKEEPVAAPAQAPASEAPEIEWAPVRVRVSQYGTGGAMPDVLVVATDATGRGHERRSDAEGNVVFEQLAPGIARIEALRTGWVAETIEGLEVTQDGAQRHLGLMRAKPTRGRVLSAIDDTPVADARVVAAARGTVGGERSQKRGDVWSVAQSDADGTFQLPAVPLGEDVTITVLARGFARAVRNLVFRATGATGQDMVFLLQPGGVVRGAVVDRTGAHVAGALICVFPDGDESLSREPRGGWSDDERSVASLRDVSDADGRFTVRGLALDARYAATAFAAGLARAEDVSGLSPSTNSREVEITLVLRTPGALEVVAKDEKGQAVAGARATVAPPHYWPAAGSGTTDAQGRTRIAGLAPGPFMLRLEMSGFLPISQDVEVHEGDTRHVELRLLRGATIAGVVLDDRDRPLAHAVVRIGRKGALRSPLAFAKTQEDGRFVFEGLEFGPHHLDVNGPGHAFERVEGVVAPAPSVRLRGVRLGLVKGRLVLPHGVAEPDRVQVGSYEATGAGGASETPWPDAPVEWHLKAEPRFLRVHGVGFAPWELEVQLKPGAVRDLGEIRLIRGVQLSGVVVGPGGDPVPGAAVEAADHHFRTTQTDAQGRFELRALRPGKQSLWVRATGFLEHEAVLDRTTDDRGLRIELSRGGALHVCILDAQGTAVVGADMEIQPADLNAQEHGEAYFARTAWDETDAQGCIRTRLPAGTYRIEAKKGDVTLVLGTAQLREGETTEIELRTP